MKKGKLFVVSGASGVGKSTVLSAVMRKCPELTFSVSATTRAPRPHEINGVDYYFVTEEKFRQMIEGGEFLEYNAHNKAFYGTPQKQLDEKLERSDVILDIEPNGAFAVRGKRPDATLIFIDAPSEEELTRRLTGRGDTSPEQIRMRLARAKWETEQRDRYDYVVINDQVEDCADRILHIIAQKIQGGSSE